MLTQLVIVNFAIIDRLELTFSDGFTVLTGETGAGKSIIVDALDFLLGQRASSDLIKTTKNKAVVEGMFQIDATCKLPLQRWLSENGFEVFDNQLIISREIASLGSKARINGSIANVSSLLHLRKYLVDIHTQGEQSELLKIEKQLEILDSFGNKSHKKMLELYGMKFMEYQDLKAKSHNFKANFEASAKKIDFLMFQVNEIKAADIKGLNEEEELLAKRKILLNKKTLHENANLIYELISSENGLLDGLSQVKKLLLKSQEHDKSFEMYLEAIEDTTTKVKELSSFVSGYRENIEQGSGNLHEIEERLDLFYNLKRKYGKSLAEIKTYYEKIQNELNSLKQEESSSGELEKLFKQKEYEINDLADKLTKSREEVTRAFLDKVNEELSALGFKQVIFVVEFLPCELSLSGKEQIQFLFTANPDEVPKPLSRVASGGELSRIMLAIKSTVPECLSKVAPTMIFDEIDIGTSGEIAADVARKLYKISRQNQIICITHNPIIAAMADSHFVIEKKVTDGETKVIPVEVTQVEKAEAIANLLTPENQSADISEDAREFARSLLENARRIKEKELLTL